MINKCHRHKVKLNKMPVKDVKRYKHVEDLYKINLKSRKNHKIVIKVKNKKMITLIIKVR